MKMEHKAIIERAKLADIPPSMLAHELLVHDLVNAGLFELKNIHSPYSKLNEGQQQEVIERLTQAANEAAHNAIAIISSRNISTIEMTMKEVKFNSKQLTLTSIVDAKNPNRHDLIDSAGHLCLLVMVPNDYDEGLDFIQPDRDQKDLPLHSSELTGSLFDQAEKGTGPDEPEYANASTTDELYGAAVEFVITSQRATVSSVQRELKVGYDRAAALIEAMAQQGVVSAMDHTGDRVVLLQPGTDDDAEQGEADPLLNDALKMVIACGRLGPAAIAGKFQISTDRARNLLESLEKAGHAAREGESVIYTAVTSKPAQVDDLVGEQWSDDKEFGDFTYDDAAQLIVLKASAGRFQAAWVQSRLAIDSDKATSLLLRLLDNGVIQLEAEGATALEHSYKVVATLADVT